MGKTIAELFHEEVHELERTKYVYEHGDGTFTWHPIRGYAFGLAMEDNRLDPTFIKKFSSALRSERVHHQAGMMAHLRRTTSPNRQ